MMMEMKPIESFAKHYHTISILSEKNADAAIGRMRIAISYDLYITCQFAVYN